MRRSAGPVHAGRGRGIGRDGRSRGDWHGVGSRNDKAGAWQAPETATDGLGLALLIPDGTRDLRIVRFNANGVRSAAGKGFFDWFSAQDADVLCLQETKAQEHQVSGPDFLPAGYKAWFRDATTRKGYSGVAIYARREPDEVRT